MSDILRQVEEDLRKERYSKFWNEYRFYIILVFIILIVSGVGYQTYTSLDKMKNEEIVEIYLEATNDESLKYSKEIFEKIQNSDNKYLSGLAELRIANIIVDKGNYDNKTQILEKIIANKSYDPIINDLALYFLLMIKLEDPDENGFMKYLNEEKLEISEFKYLFKELIAIRKLLSGDLSNSQKGFQNLVDNPDTPLTIKNRALKFINLVN